jgi:hypothetical protein
MAWAPIEKWLDQGWSPFRVTYSVMATLIFAVTLYGYASHPHHPGGLWYALGAAVIFAIWAVTEMLRWRIRHNRLKDQLARKDAPLAAAPSQPVNMDGFVELREATRPAPLSDPVTASENRIKRADHEIRSRLREENEATGETITNRMRSVSGSPPGGQAGSASGPNAPVIPAGTFPASASDNWWRRKLFPTWWERKLANADGSDPKASELARAPVTGTEEVEGEITAWQPTQPPSFTAELRRAREIDRGYDGSEGAILAIEEWTQGVYDKLYDWVPRHAEAFETWSMNDIAISASASVTGQHFEDDHHRDLNVHVARLRRILDS